MTVMRQTTLKTVLQEQMMMVLVLQLFWRQLLPSLNLDLLLRELLCLNGKVACQLSCQTYLTVSSMSVFPPKLNLVSRSWKLAMRCRLICCFLLLDLVAVVGTPVRNKVLLVPVLWLRCVPAEEIRWWPKCSRI